MTAPASGLHSIDRLHDLAREATGLDDFGDDAYLGPMAVLHDSYVRDAGLTGAGEERINAQLRAVLETRLQLVRGRRDHPETARAEIRRPVFVTGLPRTGTTALHRLLCVDPRHQGLEHWLTEAPQPRPPRDSWPEIDGYRRMARFLAARNEASPDMKGLHFMAPEMVEECWRAERLSLLSIAFQNTAHLPSYGGWLAEQQMTPAYRAHRDMLELIGLHDQGRRWVLKSPSHLFGVDALLATYPDALIVQTHRHPRTIVASVSSLNSRASAGTSTVFTPDVVGRDCLDLWARGAEQMAASRRRHDAERFLDVSYDDFVADPVGVVASIYRRLGEPFDDAVREAVRASHAESRVSDRRPDHRYSLEEFGLSEGDVDRAFAGYLDEHFGALAGG